MANNKKKKLDFRYILIEAALIVFTVLLALALNEWRNSEKEEKVKITVMNNIIKEIESNKKRLESVLEYHQSVSSLFTKYLSSDSLWSTLPEAPSIIAAVSVMEEGIRPAILQNGAWKSAELSGVVNDMDYESLYMLSSLYSIQESGVTTTWRSIANLFMQSSSYEDHQEKKFAIMFQFAFGELYSQERTLILSYENVLEVLEKYRLEE